tara:strand:- start:144 stop:296 length:153 start_codon:yes stop_codon:yes gene_type:complete
MNKYGIDAVRGGQYCKIMLSNNDKKNINKSIISAHQINVLNVVKQARKQG